MATDGLKTKRPAIQTTVRNNEKTICFQLDRNIWWRNLLIPGYYTKKLLL